MAAKSSSECSDPFLPPTDPVFNDPMYKTVRPDPRYHNTNVTKWCFATFVDYHKCQRLLGEKHPCCTQFQKIFRSICPNFWIEKWEEQLADGTFQVELPEPRKK